MLQLEALVRLSSSAEENTIVDMQAVFARILKEWKPMIDENAKHGCMVRRQLLIVITLIMKSVQFRAGNAEMAATLDLLLKMPRLTLPSVLERTTETGYSRFSQLNKEDLIAAYICALCWVADAEIETEDELLMQYQHGCKRVGPCSTVTLLESLLGDISAGQNTRLRTVALESILYILSAGQDFVPRNEILRNLSLKSGAMKRDIRTSVPIYEMMTTRLYDDGADGFDELVLTLRILNYFFESMAGVVADEKIVGGLTRACDRYDVNDEEAMLAFIRCVDSYYKFSNTSKVSCAWS